MFDASGTGGGGGTQMYHPFEVAGVDKAIKCITP